MKKLDFLSNPPKTFIFQKSSNKTTFGGILTIIYFLVILIIAFIYIYNYVVNDKYIISFINYKEQVTADNITKLEADPDYNPTLNFSFDLLDMNGEPLSKNFLLMDRNTVSLIERNKKYQYKVSDVDIAVIYKCLDVNCSLQPEDKEIYESQLYYFFRTRKEFFLLNFQDKEKPLMINHDIHEATHYVINPGILQFLNEYWQIIKIKEEKGILDNFFENKRDLIGGRFYSHDYTTINRDNEGEIIDFNFSGIYKPLFLYSTHNTYNNYAEYSRKKVSVFSLIANICSLALTIFNGLRLGFNFLYSEKFSNYKVIDNILTSKRKPKQKKIIENKFDKSFPLLSINEMKDVEIEEKEEEEKTEKINQIIEKEEDVDSLPKYHIFSFIGNFFYCKCCK